MRNRTTLAFALGAFSIGLLATTAAAKEIALLTCIVSQQGVVGNPTLQTTESGLLLSTCNAQPCNPALSCLATSDCPTGQTCGGAGCFGPTCQGVIKLLFAHGYKLRLASVLPGGQSLGVVLYTLEK